MLDYELLSTLSVPTIIESEIDDTTTEVVSVYPCGCKRMQRLRWMMCRDGSISARPSLSSDDTERCDIHSNTQQ